MGVITTKKSLVQLEKLSTASFCRRRLAVVMVRLKMSETLREAATFIEQARQLPLPQPWLGSVLPAQSNNGQHIVCEIAVIYLSS